MLSKAFKESHNSLQLAAGVDVNLLNEAWTLALQSAYNLMRALSLDTVIKLLFQTTVTCNADKLGLHTFAFGNLAGVATTWDEHLGIAAAVNIINAKIL